MLPAQVNEGGVLFGGIGFLGHFARHLGSTAFPAIAPIASQGEIFRRLPWLGSGTPDTFVF
jgi:hypothetical protein